MVRDWKAVQKFLNRYNRFLITTHLNPDGDALGSELAVAYYLQHTGKHPVILNASPTPNQYQFLDADNQIRQYDPDEHGREVKNCDAAIILDLSDWRRLDNVGDAIQKLDLPRICIDHHLNGEQLGNPQVIDETASSTGELVYDYLKSANAEITKKIAEALYTCILTDTGSFRFTNTSPTAHRIVADLIERGADFRKLYQNVYENVSPGLMKIKGQVLGNLNYECEGGLVWFAITNEMMQQAGIRRSDLEGFAEMPREISGVQISLMFSETEDGKVKMSARSKGKIEVNGLASKFSGGGHKFAAGAVFNLPLAEVVKAVLPEAIKLFS